MLKSVVAALLRSGVALSAVDAGQVGGAGVATEGAVFPLKLFLSAIDGGLSLQDARRSSQHCTICAALSRLITARPR